MNPSAQPSWQHPTQPAPAAALALRWAARWRALRVHWLLMVLAVLYVAPARADVWGYVDAQGIAHFSAARLDERYELFFRGGDGFNAGSAGNSGKAVGSGPSLASGAAAAPARLLAYFEVSPNFKAVKHLLREASARHGMDYELLQALIATESGFDARAVSPKGAVGLMQLIPPTAERYGVRADKNSAIQQKLTDPATNIRAGAKYLSDLIRLFPGQLELALAAYNAGEGAVQRAGNRVPNYPETRNYVKTVMQLYSHLKPPGMRAAATVTAAPSGRVRMEMMGGMGGATSRSSMPPATVISSAQAEGKTDLD
jgi:soluble lytic murein transglycosylase-like protein